ncbi:hypothetical protein BN85314920 [Paracholeplasma brassicae]|uniref:Uncharacterized protein n=1 Tax=Acholeplasma brassicae TaxID=61635 RepID=U4KSC5_9MOLU|nr:hypothetical protein [Paracholeplasma brassicae]CCV66513.1 hypothetical protein BN85314920 [Paracholeplasma brassicae]
MQEKQKYETPTLEVVEFELKDSIALSGQGTSGTSGNEEFWGSDW